MDRYIGLDAHAASCTQAVVSDAGEGVGIKSLSPLGRGVRKVQYVNHAVPWAPRALRDAGQAGRRSEA